MEFKKQHKIGIALAILIIAGALLLIFGIILSLYRKTKKKIYIPILIANIHALIITLFSLLTYSGMKQDAESCMAWILIMIIDFPSSLLALFLRDLIGKFIYIPYNFTRVNYFEPFILFLIFGSLQYFLITWLILKIRAKFKNKASI